MENQCWRVKLYQLEAGGIWNDQGTGFVSCEQVACNDSAETSAFAGYLIVKREDNNTVLLQSAIQYEDAYERQGESIIMWRESCVDNNSEVDYALSFENTAGCYAIWDAINDMQSFPYKTANVSYGTRGDSIPDDGMRHVSGSQNYVDHQSREWYPACDSSKDDGYLSYTMNDLSGSATKSNQLLLQELASSYIGLPSVSGDHLSEIKEKILSAFPSQKEMYASIIREQEGAYLQQLLQLSEDALVAGDITCCQRVAEIVRGIVYLNDTETLELIIKSHDIFFRVAGVMEMDPLLKEPGHFKEIISNTPRGPECIVGDNFGCAVEGTCEVDDKSLHSGCTAEMVTQLFRARLFKDRMIRPLLDDGGAVALNSLLYALQSAVCDQIFADTKYLLKILNLINLPPSKCNNGQPASDDWIKDVEDDFGDDNVPPDTKSKVNETIGDMSKRRDALCFLRELFFMSRQLSIEQRSELYSNCLNELRVPFFSALRITLCIREDLPYVADISQITAASIRVMAAEILSSVTAVCPSFLRRAVSEGAVPTPPPYCSNASTATTLSTSGKALNSGYDNDCSLLYVIIERICCDEEASVIEHLGETVKVLLDPERFDKMDKDRFLALFYDFYVQWLLVPFSDDVIPPDEVCRIVPLRTCGENCVGNRDRDAPRLSQEHFSAISSSRRFLCEIFSQCANCHSYRMKFFIVRNNVLSRILKLLKSRHKHMHIGAIKFIRAILSVKDDFYYKHIVKYDILKSVFDLFEKIYMKDTLISSAIVEVIDFIRTERIVALICYMVEKYRYLFSLCLGEVHDSRVDVDEGSFMSEAPTMSKGKLLYVEVFQKFLHTYEQVTDPVPQNSMINDISSSNHISNDGGQDTSYTRRKLNKNLAEIESEEAYFLDDSDDEDGDRTEKCGDDDEYGPIPAPETQGNILKSSIEKRNYFDNLGGVAEKRVKHLDLHIPQPNPSLESVERRSSSSLKLISDLYGDECDDEVKGGGDSTIQTLNGEGSFERKRSPVYSENGGGRFCYSPPPPNLPPLTSKFERDDEVDGSVDGTGSGNPFIQSKLLTTVQSGRRVSRPENKPAKSDSGSVASKPSGSGGIKFSMKKKPVS
jgi:hypothetical protein